MSASPADFEEGSQIMSLRGQQKAIERPSRPACRRLMLPQSLRVLRWHRPVRSQHPPDLTIMPLETLVGRYLLLRKTATDIPGPTL